MGVDAIFQGGGDGAKKWPPVPMSSVLLSSPRLTDGGEHLVGLSSVPSGVGISAESDDAARVFFFFLMGPKLI